MLTRSESFMVSWSGDDTAGSGIRSFDVFVSTDGGDFAGWWLDTEETSGIFAGEFGHTYQFYSIATDLVGYVEAGPPVADAVTTTEPLSSFASADFDNDGDVDGYDFLVWQTNFFTPSGATPNDGDADLDGDVDGEDFLVWQLQFGRESTGAGATERDSYKRRFDRSPVSRTVIDTAFGEKDFLSKPWKQQTLLRGLGR